MLVLAMKFSRTRAGEVAGKERSTQRGRANLHNGREDGHRVRSSPCGGFRVVRCRRVRQLGVHLRLGLVASTDGIGLLRKEVIQPHLPVRLPCYDFTPITDPTFDGSFLSVGPPASGVADFRGVTGGVYKARERIHPGVLIRDY